MSFDAWARWAGYFTLDGLRGGKVRHYYDEIRGSYLNGTSCETAEDKVRALIRHAQETTPFYRGLDPETPLSQMPIITKDTVRNDYAAFASEAFVNAKNNRTMYTSGSTGTPFQVVQNKNKILHNTAASIFLGAAGGYYIGMKCAFIRMWVGDHAKKSRISLLAENLIQMDCANLDDELLGEMIDVIRSKKVEVLIGYSAALGDISRYIDRHAVDTSEFRVRCILPISETMPDPVRARLMRQFHCPVRGWYCNEENGIMGIQSARTNAYYIDSESYYYEVLKMDSDEPASPFELGRIVITDLYNYATPLIRYENGDMAIADRCVKNGRFKFIVKELYGRRSDVVYDTRGRVVSPFVLYNGLAMVDGLRQYRFIQEEVDRYRLLLNGDPDKVDPEALLSVIRPYFGEDGQYVVEYVDDIPVLNSGKTKNIENTCGKYQP